MKRIVSILLVLSMVLGLIGMVSVSVFAEGISKGWVVDEDSVPGSDGGTVGTSGAGPYEEDIAPRPLNDIEIALRDSKNFKEFSDVLLSMFCEEMDYDLERDKEEFYTVLNDFNGSFSDENFKPLLSALLGGLDIDSSEDADEFFAGLGDTPAEFITSLHDLKYKDNMTREQFVSMTLWNLMMIYSYSGSFSLLDVITPTESFTELMETNGEDDFRAVIDSYKFDDCDNMFVVIPKMLGIVEGYGDNKFNPNELITREEAMTVLSRYFSVLKLEKKKGNIESVKDYSNISKWSVDSVDNLTALDIVSLTDNTVMPKDYCTLEDYLVWSMNLFYYYMYVDSRDLF